MNRRIIRCPADSQRGRCVCRLVLLFGAMLWLAWGQSVTAGNGTDIDGDGKADLVWRNTSTGDVAIWLMKGEQIVSSDFPARVPLEWQIAGIGDVTADGQADVIWRHNTNGEVAVWEMKGLAIRSVKFPGSISINWAIQGVGDVNGDGNADLIWRNSSSGVVVVWVTNGATIGLGSVPLEWQIAGIGDVTGDGKTDVIWRNSNSGVVAVWLMNGSKIISVGFPGSTSLDWDIQAVRDMDGNGQADILWRNSDSGVVAVWLMNGATIGTSGFMGWMSMDWAITQVEDVGGDGKADVIWRNSTSGQVLVWEVNGTLLARSGVIATSVSLKWIIQKGGPGSPSLFGLNFHSYINGQGPNLTSQISESQLRERMGIIRPYTKWVRTFECGDGFEKSGRIAHQLGMKAAIGAWLGRDLAANQQQIDCLVNVAKAREADLVIVGSEALLRGDITETALVNLINQVKQAVPGDIPVGYADVYSELLSHSNVMEAIDVILVNYYPYREGVQVDLGMASIQGHHQQINLAAKGKPIVVAETGWPSGGDIVGQAVPSEENACFFFQNFISWAEANAVDYYYFSSSDESWKEKHEGLQEPDLGIWDKTETLRPCIQETLEGKRIADNWSGLNILGR